MCGTVADRKGERDIQRVCEKPTTGVEFWKVTSPILERAAGRPRVIAGYAFWKGKQRILAEEEVTDPIPALGSLGEELWGNRGDG